MWGLTKTSNFVLFGTMKATIIRGVGGYYLIRIKMTNDDPVRHGSKGSNRPLFR